MKALRLHVLNRPALSRVATELGFVGPGVDPGRAALEQLTQRIDFRVEGIDTFTITFLDERPARAAEAVNRLTQLFMADENQELEGRAQSTTRILDEASRKMRADLDRAELAIVEWRRRHDGSLPEQREENLRHLDQTQIEVNILETTLQTALDRRRHLLENDISPLRKAEDEVSQRLELAHTTYTDTHPEIVRLQEEYTKLRAARVQDEQRLRHETLAHDPEVLAVGSEIDRLRARMTVMRTRQRFLRGRVDEIAQNQETLAALSLDRDGLKEKLQSTQAKLREAEVAEHVAREFRGFRMSVLEPAGVPAHAALPNRPLLFLAVLALALALGLGCGFGFEAVDPSVQDALDVEQTTPTLHVLASIPWSRSDGEPGRRPFLAPISPHRPRRSS
jgi:uncharacterized protein involved in exopolysaccharide biosynthesis